MKQYSLLFLGAILVLCSCSKQQAITVQQNEQPILRLHSANPHYLCYQNKPVILITSAEHYGAVMNAEFNIQLYLETLANEGLNYTRIIIGPYSEMGSDKFRISNNTMDPKPDQWLTPWVKDRKSGKYNLEKWNASFFHRLKSFIELASQKGIIVEVTLFSSYYINAHWMISPFYFKNNVNAIDSLPYNRVNTLDNGKIMEYQEKYVRKVVQELNRYDNLFFEIQNEPWSDNSRFIAYKNQSDDKKDWRNRVDFANNGSLDWQKRIISIIREEEKNLDKTHLIAQNFCNFGISIPEYDTGVAIFNFHYADPIAVLENQNKPVAISLDETGFMPHNHFTYRRQAWKFILAGGAVYNNLDYSFIVGKEDGSQPIDEQTPGWGGKDFRKQLLVLKDFIHQVDFIRMKPQPLLLDVLDYTVQMLAEEGKQYCAYIDEKRIKAIEPKIPVGEYLVEWIDPATGNTLNKSVVKSSLGKLRLEVPVFKEDIALRIISNEKKNQ